jgi:hypothetical protein
MMLTAVPTRWFSWEFTVNDGPRSVATIDVSWWREQGTLTVGGVDHRVYREGMLSGDFILEVAGSVVARARKPSAFRRAFAIEHGRRRYVLQAASAFRRRMVLLEGDRTVGSMSPQSAFTRRADVDLPSDLPLAVRVFIIWLAVLLWKRESDSGAIIVGRDPHERAPARWPSSVSTIRESTPCQEQRATSQPE